MMDVTMAGSATALAVEQLRLVCLCKLAKSLIWSAWLCIMAQQICTNHLTYMLLHSWFQAIY